MLFSGGTSSGGTTRPKKEKEKKVEKDDKYDVREAVFIRWANSLCGDVHELKDLVETKFLANLTSLITEDSVRLTGNRFDDIDSMFRSIVAATVSGAARQKEEEEKLLQVNIPEILAEGSQKAILGLCWQLIHVYWRKFAPPGANQRKLPEALKDWCLEACSPYAEVTIADFTSSWRDGIAMNALLKSWDPSLVDMNQVRVLRGDERLENALSLAKKHLKVPKLICAKEFASEHLDLKSVVVYLMTLYLAMVAGSAKRSPVGERRRSKLDSGAAKTGSFDSVRETKETPARIARNVPIQFFTPPDVLDEHMPLSAAEVVGRTSDSFARSRQSSTSSQRSSMRTSHQTRHEEMIREYDMCLEQVLTWLLEAEQELDSMGGNDATADVIERLSTLRRHFRQHEQFMKSLTESQGSVGKVLHRGHQLIQKLGDVQSGGIATKLAMINSRWEGVRTGAMERQLALQTELDRLQKAQLREICTWLEEFEQLVTHAEPLSDDPEICRKQTAQHTQIQEQIEAKQPFIQQLASFIAVVDPITGESGFTQLESKLRTVGQRWSVICQWAEQRAKNLDGLAQLLEHYQAAFGHLSEWLNKRKDSLSLLSPLQRLSSESKVAEQMRLVTEMEKALETEHLSFVQLSQLCSELAQRFHHDKEDEDSVGKKLQSQLEEITSTWDHIIACLEEHSSMLVGIVEPEGVENKKRKLAKRAQLEASHSLARVDSLHDETSLGENQPKGDGGTLEANQEDEEDKAIAVFIVRVAEMEKEIWPLLEWAQQFSTNVEQGGGRVRQMLQTCQKKLKEIKGVEPRVTQLQIELEKIHARPAMSSRQLHSVNSTFDKFMKSWSRVVGTISEALDILTQSRSRRESDEQILAIEQRLNVWLEKASGVLGELEHPVSEVPWDNREMRKRLAQIVEQLTEHQEHMNYLKVCGRGDGISEAERKLRRERIEGLEQKFFALLARIDKIRSISTSARSPSQDAAQSREDREDHAPGGEVPLAIKTELEGHHPVAREAVIASSPEPPPHEAESLSRQVKQEAGEEVEWIKEREAEMRKLSTTPGDVINLKAKLEKCDALISDVRTKLKHAATASQPAEPYNSDAKELLSLLLKRRELLAISLERTELAVHKFVKAEEIADNKKVVLEKLKRAEDQNLWEVEKRLEELHSTLLAENPAKVEAIRLLQEIVAIATNAEDSRKESRELAISSMRTRVVKLERQWKELTEELDEQLICLRKERKHQVDLFTRSELDLLAQVEEVVKSSRSATDAEELSEYLDNLDRLLERLSIMDHTAEVDGSWALLGELATSPEQTKVPVYVKQWDRLLRAREIILPLAKQTCESLREAISKCDYFEQALCNCQSWTNHMNQLLQLRVASDISSLEVPSEYKVSAPKDEEKIIQFLLLRKSMLVNALQFFSRHLPPQMDTEFAGYDALAEELAEFIDRNRGQWSSSDRLSLQLKHANKELAELRAKYNEFKHSFFLAQRLERTEKELKDIACAIDDLTVIEAENCEYCLIQSYYFKRRLASLREECAALEVAKDMLVREATLSETQAAELSATISGLCDECNALDGKASTLTHRLENSGDLLKKLEREEQEWDERLSQAEKEHVHAISQRSTEHDERGVHNIVERLKSKLNAVQNSAKRAKELQRILEQNSIRLSGDSIGSRSERERRTLSLRRQLATWGNKANEEESALLPAEFDNACAELASKLSSVHNARDFHPLVPLRDYVEEQGQQLTAQNDEWSPKVSQKLIELSAMWRSTEAKLEENARMTESGLETPAQSSNLYQFPSQSRLSLPLEPENFTKDVETLLAEFRATHSHLNFGEYPIEGIQDWASRLDKLSERMAECRFIMDELLIIGKRVVESGKIDPDTKKALKMLDTLIETVHKIDCDMDSSRKALRVARLKSHAFNREAKNLSTVLDILTAKVDSASHRPESDSTMLQEELQEAVHGLRMIQLAAEDLYNALPPSTPTLSFDQIFAEEHSLLSALSNALRSIEAQFMESSYPTLAITEEVVPVTRAPDAVLLSSGTTSAHSLAMEVIETTATATSDEDQGRKRENGSMHARPRLAEVGVAFTPGMSSETPHSLEQFYSNLDSIEEYLERCTQELLPLEGLEEKSAIIQSFGQELQNGERSVREREMTMGVAESDHIMQRIAAARRQIYDRQTCITEHMSDLSKLEALFAQCNTLMVALGQQWQSVSGEEGNLREASLESSPQQADKFEATQLVLENQLAPIAVNIQQCSNRFAALAERLAMESKQRFQARLTELQDDFKVYSSNIRERRKVMEERFLDLPRLEKQIELLERWCDGITTELSRPAPTLWNPDDLNRRCQRAEAMNLKEIPEKVEAMHTLEDLKDRFVTLASADPEVKHSIRRAVTQVAKRISDLKLGVGVKTKELNELKADAEEFWARVKEMEAWLAKAKGLLQGAAEATIYRSSLSGVERLSEEADARQLLIENIQVMAAQEPPSPGVQQISVEVENRHRVATLLEAFNVMVGEIRRVLHEANSASNSVVGTSNPPDSSMDGLYSRVNAAKQRLDNIASASNSIPAASVVGSDKTRRDVASADIISSRKVATMGSGPARKISVAEQGRLDTVTRLRSWLQEVEREAAATVDLADQNIVRQAVNRIQNLVDELEVQDLELKRLETEARDMLVIERTRLARLERDKMLSMCGRRRMELQRILEQSRTWDQLRSSLEIWLIDASDRLAGASVVKELSDAAIRDQVNACRELGSQIGAWKDQVECFNAKSNELLDAHPADDGHNVTHATSQLNRQWTKLSETLRTRQAMLEATEKSRRDFHSSLKCLEEWLEAQCARMSELERASSNSQMLRNTSKRKDWLAEEKEIRVEIDAHRDLVSSLGEAGKSLMSGQGASDEAMQMNERLDKVNSAWQRLCGNHNAVRARLEGAQKEHEALMRGLADMLYWTEQQLLAIVQSQPVGGDLATLQKQTAVIRAAEKSMEAKESEVQGLIHSTQRYLQQYDLRPQMHTPSALLPNQQNEPQLTEQQREERRIGAQMLADSERLSTEWERLKKETSAWSEIVANAHHEIEELERAIADSVLNIGAIEDELQRRLPVEALKLEDLKEAKCDNAQLRTRAREAGIRMDDVNDLAGQCAAQNIVLTSQVESQIHAANQRYEKLKRDVGCRGAALERALQDFGPSSEHFLLGSVEPPWQRAISSSNDLPYYVDHDSENTQWDNPAMVNILEQICSFNQVKFSAYRTAMKLRAIQKRLCLDLLELSELDESFGLHLKEYPSPLEDRLRMEDAILTLLPLFELAQERHPKIVTNVALAVDLALNLLLNIYDPCRDGKLRVLSFKIALVVLCNASLESKYKYLFHLMSSGDTTGMDHRLMAILFYDLIHIPKFLGEAAAFGGSNVEPSVRSCFSYAKFAPTIDFYLFLGWLRKEPQSLVWLAVMHRLTSSELAKHQAKCNACKMYPIVGLRYRCLRCFNFDICQNCFFSQRTAKNHKLTHPMQEYCLPTHPKDDVRDFTEMLRNKVRKSRNYLGYLPVEQVNEGRPLERMDENPQNPATESIHLRMHLLAQRLELKHGEPSELFSTAEDSSLRQRLGVRGKSVSIAALQPMRGDDLSGEIDSATGPPGLASRVGEIKSPSQLLTHVGNMRKEELDALLEKLQFENMQLRRAMEEKRRAALCSQKSTPNLHYRVESPRSSPVTSHSQFYHQHSSLRTHQRASAGTPEMGQSPRVAPTIDAGGSHLAGGVYASMQTLPLAGMSGESRRLGASTEGLSSGGAFAGASSLPPLPPLISRSQPNGKQPMGGAGGGPANAMANGTGSRSVGIEASLRLQQQRLDQRSRLLENQNAQLRTQLVRLQQMMRQREGSETNRFASETMPRSINGGMAHAVMPYMPTQMNHPPLLVGAISSTEEEGDGGAIRGAGGHEATAIRRSRMDKLMNTVEELNRAMESFVGSIVVDRRDSHDTDGDSSSRSEDNDNTTVA